MILRERYIKQLEPFIGKPVIKVITGIRRCGKSTFLKMICDSLVKSGINHENIILINKDSLDFDFIQNYHDLDAYVQKQCENITSSKKIANFLKSQKIKGAVDTIHNYRSKSYPYRVQPAGYFGSFGEYRLPGASLPKIYGSYWKTQRVGN
ncbi:MAG: AAA family ATPase [Bacteroidia bacterium]|nr:AAA family ATPase [Bacteroidia bacterium]